MKKNEVGTGSLAKPLFGRRRRKTCHWEQAQLKY